MADVIDANEVLMTGENSFIRLSSDEGGQVTTRVSHWRVLHSPGGQGHALFLTSELTGGEIRAYSDNIAVARWLQEDLESMIYPDFADQGIPVTNAVFDSSGDGRSYWTETVESEADLVSLTWYDFLTPFVIHAAPNSRPNRPLGVYSCFTPARRAQVLSSQFGLATGIPTLEPMENRESSSACMAWSETWVKPR